LGKRLSNNISLILAAIIIGSSAIISGPISDEVRSGTMKRQEAACWAPSVVTRLNRQATQEASQQLISSFPDNFDQNNQDRVLASFVAKVSDYAYADTNTADDFGSINCMANLSYSYTKFDGTKFSSNVAIPITYTVYPGQVGWVPDMGQDDIPDGSVIYDNRQDSSAFLGDSRSTEED
jgi:hypothetical protein